MSQSVIKKNLFGLYLLLILPFCLEAALLILGYRPFHQVAFQMEATPDHYLIPHQHFGFSLNPGQYEVKLNQGLVYTATHSRDSLRVTAYQKEEEKRPQSIWFFGCSYTYGMGIDDSLAFPFLVQQNSPRFNTLNFGVPGYGTVQSYLQLQQRIALGQRPSIAIINYADFHDDRNALTPAYRRDLFLGYQRSHATVKAVMQNAQVPYVKTAEDGYEIAFCRWDSIYQNWQYRETFATVNFLQDFLDQRQAIRIDQAAITHHTFLQIKELCDNNGIRLIVTGLTPSEKTRKLLTTLQTAGIETCNIAVELSLDKYHNAPYDDHPNALAHAIFAQRIMRYLNINH